MMICLHRGDFSKTLNHVRANLIVTSPPYNIGSESPAKTGFRKFGLFDPKSWKGITDYPDEMPEATYQITQEQFLLWAADHLVDNGVLVYNHKPRRINGMMIHPAEWFLRPAVKARLVLLEEVIWDRGSTHNHGQAFMWPQTERLYVFRKPLGRYPLKNDRRLLFRADVWRIPFAHGTGHNAPFPPALARAVVEAWSQRGDLVCDPYAGSGTIAVACRELGRDFEGSEILAKYYRLALRNVGT